jgi:hypothetical protein
MFRFAYRGSEGAPAAVSERLVRCGDGNTGRMWDFQTCRDLVVPRVWEDVHSSGMDRMVDGAFEPVQRHACAVPHGEHVETSTTLVGNGGSTCSPTDSTWMGGGIALEDLSDTILA